MMSIRKLYITLDCAFLRNSSNHTARFHFYHVVCGRDRRTRVSEAVSVSEVRVFLVSEPVPESEVLISPLSESVPESEVTELSLSESLSESVSEPMSELMSEFLSEVVGVIRKLYGLFAKNIR